MSIIDFFFLSVQFSLFVSPQTLQSEHGIYKINKLMWQGSPKEPILLILFEIPCDNFLYTSLRIIVVRWNTVSNSKDNGK